MRQINSVCFVQSCYTLWDTVFYGSSEVSEKERSDALSQIRQSADFKYDFCVIYRESAESFPLSFVCQSFSSFFVLNVPQLFHLSFLGFISVDDDTEGSSRSGRESMSASGELIAVDSASGRSDEREKDPPKESQKEKKLEKDKNKSKKGVLKGLGDMFR